MKNSELNKLKENYPEIVPKDFHFGCADGWADLIEATLIVALGEIRYKQNEIQFLNSCKKDYLDRALPDIQKEFIDSTKKSIDRLEKENIKLKHALETKNYSVVLTLRSDPKVAHENALAQNLNQLGIHKKNLSEQGLESWMIEGLNNAEGLNEQISKLGNDIKDLAVDVPKLSQVKEKFGLLRIYYNKGNPELNTACSVAEFLSSKTCEVCGNKGSLRPGSWIRTLCDKHLEKH